MKMTSSLSVIWKNVDVCAAPFVEHLQKEKKKIYYQITKEKNQKIFLQMASFQAFWKCNL